MKPQGGRMDGWINQLANEAHGVTLYNEHQHPYIFYIPFFSYFFKTRRSKRRRGNNNKNIFVLMSVVVIELEGRRSTRFSSNGN